MDIIRDADKFFQRDKMFADEPGQWTVDSDRTRSSGAMLYGLELLIGSLAG